jgi:outer membrane receptor protein involved in Fe transport
MRPRTSSRELAPWLAILFTILPTAALAGTTGKISGTIRDAKKQPLVGANVAVIGAPLGAASDENGRYVIVNVPAGSYSIKASMLGYRATTVTQVAVSADLTTKIDVVLPEEAVELQEVVVSAKRPVVDLNLTSSRATVTREEIAKLPVQELQDVVNLQAGVVDGHIRGGRQNEVQWQVDGVTVNNVYDNKSTLRIDRSLIEEVQVVSGTFDAEYGQAMSGVVNAVLKRGTDKFEWSGEVMNGSYVYPQSGRPAMVTPLVAAGLPLSLDEYQFRPGDLQNYQLNLSGPTGLPNTTFLVSGRRGTTDESYRAYRYFTPATTVDTTIHNLGDGANVPLGWSNEWSGIAKVTNRGLLKGVEVSYQALFNDIEAMRGDDLFRFNPDGQSKQHTRSLMHGIDWTHALTRNTFYKVSLRQNLYKYTDFAYADFNDTLYDVGPPKPVVPGFLNDTYTQGVSFTRFLTETNTWVANGSATRQVSPDWLIKVGGELQRSKVTFGVPGNLAQVQLNGEETVIRVVEDPAANYFAPVTYHPVLGSAYVHNELEWNDLNLRLGLRWDMFDANSTTPSDPANPANAITGVPQSVPKPTTIKSTIAPRIGVSYPISDKAALFFAYAHLYQMPGMNDAFANADYRALQNLQAASDRFGVMGNPDIKPQKTVTYQLGYKQALNDRFGMDLTAFYKDIRDLLGVEIISTYNDARYARYTNVDFGSVVGFTVMLDQRPIGPLSATLDYTWQNAVGNASDPNETATRAEAGQDARPRQIPFNWDQRHTLNLTVTLSKPAFYNLATVIRVASGQPYTPNTTTGFGAGQEANSGRKPMGMVVDLRGEYGLFHSRNAVTAFARVFNVFDTRYFNGPVFETTGSPYYSRFPTTDQLALTDPTRLYPPRRIELGLTLSGREK